MAREVWVIERRPPGCEWIVYFTYTNKDQARRGMARERRGYKEVRWRLVRYVPEDEK